MTYLIDFAKDARELLSEILFIHSTREQKFGCGHSYQGYDVSIVNVPAVSRDAVTFRLSYSKPGNERISSVALAKKAMRTLLEACIPIDGAPIAEYRRASIPFGFNSRIRDLGASWKFASLLNEIHRGKDHSSLFFVTLKSSLASIGRLKNALKLAVHKETKALVRNTFREYTEITRALEPKARRAGRKAIKTMESQLSALMP